MIINSKTETIARRVPSLVSDLLVALSGTLVLGLAAQLELRLPFTPVPVTAQTFVVMLIGALVFLAGDSLSVGMWLMETNEDEHGDFQQQIFIHAMISFPCGASLLF